MLGLLTKYSIKKFKAKNELKFSDFSSVQGIIGTLFKMDNLILADKYEWYIFSKYYETNNSETRRHIKKYVQRVRSNFSVSSYEFFSNYGRGNGYNVEYVMHRDCIDRLSAELLIQDLKDNTCGSLESYIKRHGEALGKLKYEEFKNKSAQTLDNFKLRYGSKAEEKWAEYLKTKDSSSLEFFINKYGEATGTRKYSEKISKTTHTLDDCITRHGETIGAMKYEDANKKRSEKLSTAGLIETFGYEKALKINKSKAQVSPERSLKYYIDKFGTDDGLIAFKKFLTSSSRVTENTVYAIDIYIENLGYENGIKEYLARKKIEYKGRQQASAQSLSIFEDSEDLLSKNRVKYSIGNIDNRELHLKTEDGKRYYYDLTIPSLNLIFEFQGEHVHPNPNKNKEFWNNWKHSFTGETADEVQIKYDKKIKLAEDNGYEVHQIWSSDIDRLNSEKVVNIIKEKLNENN